MKTYKLINYRGSLPEQGTEWWTDEQWARHKAHVAKLKAEGTYLEPYEVTVTLVENPTYDTPKYLDKDRIPLSSSASFKLIDFSKPQ